MKRLSAAGQTLNIIVPAAVFLGVIIISGLIWIVSGGTDTAAGVTLAFSFITLMLAGNLAWLVRDRTQRQTTGAEYSSLELDSQDQVSFLKGRLEGMIQLNELMINAQTEEEIIDKALNIISEVAGLSGVSFVPYDEWGQPLHSYVYTSEQPPTLSPWSEYLATPDVRHRCQNCLNFHGDTENDCPLLAAPFTKVDQMTCLPLKRGHQVIGVVNLYLHDDQEISAELNDYLLVMLDEMSLALEITRLRNQELTTLRQLQLEHNQPEELAATVEKLISGLCKALDFKYYRAVFKASAPGISGLDILSEDDPWLSSEDVTGMIHRVMQPTAAEQTSTPIQRQANDTGILLAPFRLPEGSIVGALLLAGAPYAELSPRQAGLIQTVTNHTAILVENEHRKFDIEYRTIMQERVRLAREIHDSLAQTLAYLKLMSAQMQSQLDRGDLTRLEQSLKQSHKALSEAYLETREAIDNLRLAPSEEIDNWLTTIARNFEQTSGLNLILSIPDKLTRISPEVQAQLIRIIQESLSNIRKHSRASRVWLNAREWNNHLVIDLGDDGIGFSADDTPDFSRHGLRGMHERADLIGAEFQITSQDGHGTTIHIEVPLEVKETTA